MQRRALSVSLCAALMEHVQLGRAEFKLKPRNSFPPLSLLLSSTAAAAAAAAAASTPPPPPPLSLSPSQVPSQMFRLLFDSCRVVIAGRSRAIPLNIVGLFCSLHVGSSVRGAAFCGAITTLAAAGRKLSRVAPAAAGSQPVLSDVVAFARRPAAMRANGASSQSAGWPDAEPAGRPIGPACGQESSALCELERLQWKKAHCAGCKGGRCSARTRPAASSLVEPARSSSNQRHERANEPQRLRKENHDDDARTSCQTGSSRENLGAAPAQQ